MFDQTKVNGTATPTSSPAGVRKNLAGLSHDVLALLELQVRLFLYDISETFSRGRTPAVMIALGLVMALGALPLLLLGGARAMIDLAGFTAHSAYFAVGFTTLALAIAIGWGAFRSLRTTLEPLHRSQAEFQQNIVLLKTMLRRRSGMQPDSVNDRNRNDRAEAVHDEKL